MNREAMAEALCEVGEVYTKVDKYLYYTFECMEHDEQMKKLYWAMHNAVEDMRDYIFEKVE